MTKPYHPNSLAAKIIKLFLASPSLIYSSGALADRHGVTSIEIRRALAQAIGNDILCREYNDLTGEQDYVAGSKLQSMRHLLPADDDASSPTPAPQEPDPAPANAIDPDEAVELIQITSADMPSSRISLDELKLIDLPPPTGRAVVSRYDGHFREALESGRAITMPPDYVKPVADAARNWVRHHKPKYEARSIGRLPGRHFGAVWIVTRKPPKKAVRE